MRTTTQRWVHLAAIAGVAAVTATASHAALLVYEGFQYSDPAVSDGLHGQPDGAGGADTDATGLSGTWQDQTTISTGNMFLKAGSLAFGDLPTAGNHVGSNTNQNNDIFIRPIASNLSAGGELWFGVLAEKLQNNFSAAEGGLVIGNQGVSNSRVLLDTGGTGLAGFGVAPTTSGNNWTPYAWDGTSQVVGDAAVTVGVGSGDIRLLVGRISYDTGAGGADQFTLYDYQLNGGSVVGGTLSPIASTIEVDVDQAMLDTLSLSRQVNTNWDEIRIGTTLDDVLGIPEPSSTALVGLFGAALLRRRRWTVRI